MHHFTVGSVALKRGPSFHRADDAAAAAAAAAAAVGSDGVEIT